MPIKNYKVQTNKRPGDGKQAQWSQRQKYEAVALYKLLGSLTLVAETSKFPLDTLNHWHIQDWWKDAELEVASASRAKLTGKLGVILEASLKVVEDRLENGDFHYDQKLGKVVRKPVNAHVANKIMNDSIDRTILLERLAAENRSNSSTEKIADRLTKLQQDFEKMAGRNYRRSETIIDVQATYPPPQPVEAAVEASSPISEDV